MLAVTKEHPHPDYKLYAEQMNQIGNELNYVARKYHVLGVIDIQRYDNACKAFRHVIDEVTNEVN